MTDAPEKIWMDGDIEVGDGYWTRCFETPKPCSEPAIEYTRTDLHLALVAAAYEKSGSAAVGWANAFANGEEWTTCGIYNHITARTPDDAVAELEKVKREARNEALRDLIRETKLHRDKNWYPSLEGAILALMEDTNDE